MTTVASLPQQKPFGPVVLVGVVRGSKATAIFSPVAPDSSRPSFSGP
ncbi:hypothetical protein [Streptosporangium minutum]|nr:hypothetical protein [Streptosporangium minutum]